VPEEVVGMLAPGRLQFQLIRRLASLNEDTLLHDDPFHPSGVREVLQHGAQLERLQDVGRMLKAIFLPEREWLATRYGWEEGGSLWVYRLRHLLRLGRAFIRGLRKPLIASSLE
jgi:hypothetical protein